MDRELEHACVASRASERRTLSTEFQKVDARRLARAASSCLHKRALIATGGCSKLNIPQWSGRAVDKSSRGIKLLIYISIAALGSFFGSEGRAASRGRSSHSDQIRRDNNNNRAKEQTCAHETPTFHASRRGRRAGHHGARTVRATSRRPARRQDRSPRRLLFADHPRR